MMNAANGENKRNIETSQSSSNTTNITENNENTCINPTQTPNCTIRGCGSNRCKLCPQLVKSSKVKSTNSGREYDCIFETEEADCHSVNLIYLITCDNCKLQYVGQTVQHLNLRMNQHRGGTLGSTGCRVLTEHIKSYPCNGYGFSVQIIQTLSGTGRNRYDLEDQVITQKRVSIEEEWMIKLRTVYPYGLNDKCHGSLWTNPSEGIYTGRSLFRKLERSDSNPTLVRCLKSAKNPRSVTITLHEIEGACKCIQNNENNENPSAPCTLNFARKIILSPQKQLQKNWLL
jgi:hypothetical protein